MRIGAWANADGGADFAVWGPLLENLELRILTPERAAVPMTKDSHGFWHATVERIQTGSTYWYRINDKHDRPDPGSFYQPEGVHQPSQLIDHAAFRWSDSTWRGTELSRMTMYELHVGTFTPQGTFDAIIPRLDDLKALGINTIQLMPVGQFPGERNWGYDGAYLFAVQNSYGGPDGLKKFVDSCHAKGIAVILDVIYNHLGPEGNYIAEYCPYFTDKYHTPWGKAVNYDDAYSDGVRNFVVQNTIYWFEQYHIDGLRLDAVHGIFDTGAKHILQELSEEVEAYDRQTGRKHYLIAESDLNDVRVILPRNRGGYGLDAQWSDDFHHSVHTLLTGDANGYYVDFGRPEHLVKALEEGFVNSWDYSIYRKRHHGSSSCEATGDQLVVFSQNHDQVGNRLLGDRLLTIAGFEAAKLAATITVLSPFVPLLFMGEEYGEDAPFPFFVSHGDPDLVAGVREGRKAEFRHFGWQKDPPDPQSERTFLSAKLDWSKRETGRYKVILDYYTKLFALRSESPALRNLSKTDMTVHQYGETRVLGVLRRHPHGDIYALYNMAEEEVKLHIAEIPGVGTTILDSSDETWAGPGCTSPDQIESGTPVVMRPFGCTVYELKE